MTNVLLIDDDVDLVEMNKIVLESEGFAVKVAYDGTEARELLKRGSPDVAVFDVMMETDTAGFELARDTHQQYPELPIIMLSGIHQEKNLNYRFEPDETWLPILKFMDKPINPVDLVIQIKTILSDN